jgi:hypothetical protein
MFMRAGARCAHQMRLPASCCGRSGPGGALNGSATQNRGTSATVEHEGQTYRCMFVFGPALVPDGVRWIKMTPDGREPLGTGR